MKSTFLLSIVFSALIANVAWAQMSLRPTPQDMKPNEKTSFEKFSERLKIAYFGVFTTPHFDDMENGKWNNAAISPEFGNAAKGKQKNQDTWPTNLWNQVSFNYNFGAKLNFVVNPRFLIPLTHAKDMKAPEDRAQVSLDDLLVGFQGVIFKSEDKKFNVWIRPGMRIPTSQANRNPKNPDVTLTRQVELAHNITYDFDKTWQLGFFGNFRQYVVEDKYGFDRFRIYMSPFIQYTIDDTSRLITYYNNILETDRRSKPANDRDPVFKDKWQELQVGYSKDVTSKLNLFPFVALFVNDKPITDKSAYIGAWITYQIK